MSNDLPTEPDKYQSLVQRFDERARRLRRQANLFLGIIIVVLVAGAALFIFANYIANLTLHPQTTEAQYAAAVAAQTQTQEQEVSTSKQIEIINDASLILKPYNEKLRSVRDERLLVDDAIIKKCNSITRRYRFTVPVVSSTMSPPTYSMVSLDIENAQDRIGEFRLTIPDQSIYFANYDDAGKCRALFLPERDKILIYLRGLQDITRDGQEAAEKFRTSKLAELTPLSDRLSNLQGEEQRRQALVSTLLGRLTQERVLGAPLPSGKEDVTKESAGTIDWPQVIQNNVTRIGAILLTVFLVTILVPQYRYNIRMASFYNARSDSVLLSTQAGFNWPDDLINIVTIMTSNIDFGKAPPTPVEQVIEMIKAVKS